MDSLYWHNLSLILGKIFHMISFLDMNSLKYCVIHKIGGGEEDKVIFSPENFFPENEVLKKSLQNYFLSIFKEPEFFRFREVGGSMELNPVFHLSSGVFETPENFYDTTKTLVNHLQAKSSHHLIKGGEVICFYLKDVIVEDEAADAFGLIKLEEHESFLKIIQDDNGRFQPIIDSGFQLSKPDKAYIVFNTERDLGFKILQINHVAKSKEAVYWTESFLAIEPRNDHYFQTKNYLQLTHDFIKERYNKGSEQDKSLKSEALNNTKSYFKLAGSFDELTFTEQVFKDENVISSFQNYKQAYEEQTRIEFSDHFEISSQAVKKQSRFFKSVLKLDKNFHIYIHGNREMIDKGIDENGRKYYILYYNEES